MASLPSPTAAASRGSNNTTRPLLRSFSRAAIPSLETMQLHSKRLVASYVLDWIIILAFAGAGGGLNFVSPYKRPFSLLDLSISFPFQPESISVATVGIVSLVGPAAVIVLVTLLLVPGPKFSRQLSRRELFAIKVWELEKGLAGLALSLATAFFVTQALKNLFGKPRPNSMGMCMPDLSAIASHTVGGYGQAISDRWVLLDAGICTNPDTKQVWDAFRSFPSGHCSFSWSGMLYLTLFLCSKFAIVFPYLPVGAESQLQQRIEDIELLPVHQASSSQPQESSGPLKRSVRNLAASPPNHLVVVAFIPIGVAIYICSTRYAEFYHFGFDIIGSSVLGIISSIFAFRWYHLPLGRGQGWAWGPRSEHCAFGIGVGVGSYVAHDA